MNYLKVNKNFIKLLPVYLIILSLVVLMGTSYSLLKSSHQGENSYTVNVANLEVTFQDSSTSTLTLDKAIPITDEEGKNQDDYLEFTIKNTGSVKASYNVHIDETSTSPAFKSVINYITKIGDNDYGDVVNLAANNIIDSGELDVNESITYRVKCWISEDADSTYMNKTFTAKIVVDTNQFRGTLYDEVKSEMIGTSDDIDFNVSSMYAESLGVGNEGYTAPGVYQLKDEGIYFYRGSVTNNNVLFANYCWKIVRTTATKGVKLIYNGSPTSDGKCTNTTGSSTYVGQSKFNSSSDDAKYVGYTYDVDGTENDSIIKTYIDNWYSTNMTSYTSKLEDTDWCNDRSVVSSTDEAYSNLYSPPNSSYTYFGSYTRAGYRTINVKPTTVCPQNSDKYTVSSENGNGLLAYPVGLMTLDEYALAGATSYYSASGAKSSSIYINSSYYLYNSAYNWTISPVYFSGSNSYVGVVGNAGYLDNNGVGNAGGVRPAVSLASNALITSGDGTSSTPYVVN